MHICHYQYYVVAIFGMKMWQHLRFPASSVLADQNRYFIVIEGWFGM